MRQFFIFFILLVLAGLFLCASAFVEPIHLTELLILSCVCYGVGLFYDVRSTMRFGRKTVGAMEVSPIFRVFSRKFGFAVAMPVQVATEISIAMLLPFAVNYHYNPVTTYFCLFLFCGIHFLGYKRNSIILSRY